MAVPGVKMADFLRHAATNVRRPDRKEGEELIPMREFRQELKAKMEQLKMDPEFARRYVNDGFSRRRNETGGNPPARHAAAQVRHP